MIVPKKVRDKWKLLKEGGDVSYLAGMLRVSKSNISRALNGGVCNDEVFAAISDFYTDRANKRAEKVKASAKAVA